MKTWLRISIAVLAPTLIAAVIVLAVLIGPWILGAVLFFCFLVILGLAIYFELE